MRTKSLNKVLYRQFIVIIIINRKFYNLFLLQSLFHYSYFVREYLHCMNLYRIILKRFLSLVLSQMFHIFVPEIIYIPRIAIIKLIYLIFQEVKWYSFIHNRKLIYFSHKFYTYD